MISCERILDELTKLEIQPARSHAWLNKLFTKLGAAAPELKWRDAFELVAMPALLDALDVAGVQRPLWHALSRNIAKTLSGPTPADTLALLLRDARATWVVRGVAGETWDRILAIAIAIRSLDSDITHR